MFRKDLPSCCLHVKVLQQWLNQSHKEGCASVSIFGSILLSLLPHHPSSPYVTLKKKFLQLSMSIMKVAWCNGENTGLRKSGTHFLLTAWPWKSPFPPSFLICSIIILSACLPLRDVVRLRKTAGWKQFVFLSRLPLSISPPLHPYLWF